MSVCSVNDHAAEIKMEVLNMINMKYLNLQRLKIAVFLFVLVFVVGFANRGYATTWGDVLNDFNMYTSQYPHDGVWMGKLSGCGFNITKTTLPSLYEQDGYYSCLYFDHLNAEDWRMQWFRRETTTFHVGCFTTDSTESTETIYASFAESGGLFEG
jgi:hypothetical protein